MRETTLDAPGPVRQLGSTGTLDRNLSQEVVRILGGGHHGDRTLARDPLGNKTVIVYDPNRNVIEVDDANLNKTKTTVNFNNEVTQIQGTDQNNVVLRTLQTVYDGNGNVDQQIDGLNHVTKYVYDPLNHAVSITYAVGLPEARTTSYVVDAVGNLVSKTDSASPNRTTSYSYDVADELSSINYSDGVTPRVAYTYDAIGRRISMVDGIGSSSYTYDSLSRLTNYTSSAGATVGYGYNLRGLVTRITYPDPTKVVTQAYDNDGRLQTIQDWVHASPFTFSYDANSNLTHVAYPRTDTYADYPTYDNADRLRQLNQVAGGANILSLGYLPDNKGQTLTEGSRGYGYDPLDRVQTAVLTTTSTYTYDGADRLTRIQGSDGRSRVFTSDNADRLQAFTDTQGALSYSYQYDNNGNRIGRTGNGQTLAYAYDQANRLTGYRNSLDSTQNATYKYNGDGLRLSKTVNQTTTNHVWSITDGMPSIIQDSIAAATTYYITGPGGYPLEQINGSQVYYYHHDKLGNARALSDDNGTVAATYDYDPYGNPLSTTGSVSNPFRYAGQYMDVESGLEYLRARYYDPATAQFMSRDPRSATTRQPYAYVSDQPVDRTDPSGKDWWNDAKSKTNDFLHKTAPLSQVIGDTFSNAATYLAVGAAVYATLGVAAAATEVGAPLGAALLIAAGATVILSEAMGVFALGFHVLAGLGGEKEGWRAAAWDAIGIVLGAGSSKIAKFLLKPFGVGARVDEWADTVGGAISASVLQWLSGHDFGSSNCDPGGPIPMPTPAPPPLR